MTYNMMISIWLFVLFYVTIIAVCLLCHQNITYLLSYLPTYLLTWSTVRLLVVSSNYRAVCDDMMAVYLFILSGSNLHPSLEKDSGIDTNTGSLPNLSDLQFGGGVSSDDILNAMGHHGIGPMRVSGPQGSPGSRHRRARTGPKPLFLPSAPCVAPYQVQVLSVFTIGVEKYLHSMFLYVCICKIEQQNRVVLLILCCLWVSEFVDKRHWESFQNESHSTFE